MDLQLAGKVAIVTGASRGIGRAIAEGLAWEGMRVVLAARSKEQLEGVVAELQAPSLVQSVDLRRPEAAAAVVDAALSAFGQIDLLVNNAGATVRGDFLELSDEAWQDGFALKFFAAMRCSRAAWVHLQARKGAIVNIVGLAGRTGNAESTIGGAVNAAVLNLTKSLADRGVADGVRVNAINPGTIATERLQRRIERFASEHRVDHAAAAQQMAQALGVARYGEPEEIANMVAFLASPRAAYCNGAIIDVDGGCTRTL